MSDQETAECRHCGFKLKGKPYYMGGQAYHPRTNERARVNYYGGYVCSQECDFRASLSLEQSMPGHGSVQRTLGSFAHKSYKNNWGDL